MRVLAHTMPEVEAGVGAIRAALGRRIIHNRIASVVHARVRVSAVAVRLVDVNRHVINLVGHAQSFRLGMMQRHDCYLSK